MIVDIDNDKHEIFFNYIKSNVTWEDKDHRKIGHENGIDIEAEILSDIKWAVMKEFKIDTEWERQIFTYLMFSKIKLKWDDE